MYVMLKTYRFLAVAAAVCIVCFCNNLVAPVDPILPGPPKALAVVSPQSGADFHVGDTLHVIWSFDSTVDTEIVQLSIQISASGGEKFTTIGSSCPTCTLVTSVNQSMWGTWGHMMWQIPESKYGVSMVSDSCIIQIQNFFPNTPIAQSTPFFSIKSNRVQ